LELVHIDFIAVELLQDLFLKVWQKRDLTLKAINEALETLPLQQKRVFKMAKMEGKSYEEIAALLGISKATIHTHMPRAALTIKEHIRIHQTSFTLSIIYYLIPK
jgi:DNA-binding NarL/FixJ family response regulator